MHALSVLILMMILATSAHATIRFDKNIMPAEAEFMKKDLNFLKSLDFHKAADDKTLDTLEIDELNSKTADHWLRERFKMVVADEPWETFSKRFEVGNTDMNFPNQHVSPAIEKSFLKPTPGKAVVVMSNMGTSLYMMAKQRRLLLKLNIPTYTDDDHAALISSPRDGIFKVGPGLFMKKFLINKDNEKSPANRINRLTTYFHEARHSDGNGKHIGFIHAVCPEDHDLKGYYACDRNLNGSYTVGAVMMKEMLKNCESCTTKEKEILKLRYLGSLNRVIKVTRKPGEPITAKEQEMADELKANTREYFSIQNEERKDKLRPRIKYLTFKLMELSKANNTVIEIPSKKWDPRPEGLTLAR